MSQQNSSQDQPENVQLVVPGVPRETVKRIDALAKANGRSRAGQIRVWIDRAVKKESSLLSIY